MREAGYTLVECLAALTILSLASIGLLQCVQMIADQQTTIAASARAADDLWRAQAALDRLLEDAGPFRSHEPNQLSGTSQAFVMACGGREPCQASLLQERDGAALRLDRPEGTHTLRLHDPGPVRFIYRGRLGPSDAWPPSRPERQPLRAIAVVAGPPGQARALLQSAIWREQPADCAFDPVLGDCR